MQNHTASNWSSESTVSFLSQKSFAFFFKGLVDPKGSPLEIEQGNITTSEILSQRFNMPSTTLYLVHHYCSLV